jgi:hypothetical protein
MVVQEVPVAAALEFIGQDNQEIVLTHRAEQEHRVKEIMAALAFGLLLVMVLAAVVVLALRVLVEQLKLLETVVMEQHHQFQVHQ